MLGVFPNSAPDGINKSLEFAQALTKESLKSFLADGDVDLVFYLMLVLLPAEQSGIFQEDSRKQNSVWACGTGCGEVVFALLEEIVTLQVNFILINVWEQSFQKPLTWAFIVQSGGNNKSRNRCKSRKKKRFGLKNDLDNPLEVILQVSNHGGVGKARSNKQNNDRCNRGSRSTCHTGSRGATVATLGRGSASKLVFAVMKILARTATSKNSSHWAG